MPDPVVIYTVAELASMLKLHPATVQRKARAGKYPHTKLGNEYRFTEADYQSILEEARPKPKEDTRAARKALRLRMKNLNSF